MQGWKLLAVMLGASFTLLGYEYVADNRVKLIVMTDSLLPLGTPDYPDHNTFCV